MGNFLKSLLFGEDEETEESKAKRNFDVLKYDGIKAVKVGKNSYAIRCFQEALKIQEDSEVLEYLIAACSGEDRLEEAIEAATRLLVLKSQHPGVLAMRAKLYYVNRQYPEAIADCESIIAQDSNAPVAYYLMAQAKGALKDDLGALVSLSQAIALKDDFTEARMLRAEILMRARDYKEGMQDAQKVVESDPEEETAWMLRARFYEALGENEQAESDYRHVMELNPFNEHAYLHLGELFMSINQPVKARELLDEAIEINPDFARAYRERGRARLMCGDQEGSVADMKKALELNDQETDLKKVEGTYSNFEEMYRNRVL